MNDEHEHDDEHEGFGDIDPARFTATYERLVAISPERERILDVATRSPGLNIRPTDDEDVWEMYLVDRQHENEVVVVGRFAFEDVRRLDADELDAASEEKFDFIGKLERLNALPEPGFPAEVSNDFREQAVEIVEYMTAVAKAAERDPEARLELSDIDEFAKGFRADGLDACADALHRIREWTIRNTQRRADDN
jgi:hypothetical protein